MSESSGSRVLNGQGSCGNERIPGKVGYASGLVASSLFDLPTGATVVVALVSAFALTALLKMPQPA